MIINVKGTRSKPTEGAPSERYVLQEKEQRSKTPYAFVLFLTGAVLFLKSLFPSRAEEDAIPRAGENDISGEPEQPMAQPDPPAPDAEPDTDAPRPEFRLIAGPAGGQGEIPAPATFTSIEPLEVGRFLLPEAPLIWADVPLSVKAALPANDNSDRYQSGTAVQEFYETPKDEAEPPFVEAGEDTDAATDDLNDGDGDGDGACGCDGPRKDASKEDRTDEGDPSGENSERKTEASSGNRAPRATSPVQLIEATGSAVLVIGLVDLLRNAYDPDGDALTVENLTVSSGAIVSSEDHWIYNPDPQFTGAVTLSYDVSDGLSSIGQTAHFNIVEEASAKSNGGAIFSSEGIGAEVIQDGDDDGEGYGGDVAQGEEGHIVSQVENIHHFEDEHGNNTIVGTDGDDYIVGSDGNDRIFGGAGNDVIFGGDGDDIIYGGEGDDYIDGGAGNDVIFDGEGSDMVFGGPGNDIIVAALDGADDIYDGGEGCDTLDYSAATQDLLIDLVNCTASGVEIGNDTIRNFEIVHGGGGDDHFIVGGTPVTLAGRGGQNTFEFVGAGIDMNSASLMYEILDFKVGDRIRMSKYDLFEKIFDELDDKFEKVYGDEIDDDDIKIRYRHEREDDLERTIIEADFDGDTLYETTIVLEGRHLLVIVENA